MWEGQDEGEKGDASDDTAPAALRRERIEWDSGSDRDGRRKSGSGCGVWRSGELVGQADRQADRTVGSRDGLMRKCSQTG